MFVPYYMYLLLQISCIMFSVSKHLTHGFSNLMKIYL